jgi:hypothetical protein
MRLYRFEISQGGGERELLWPLDHTPAIGEVVWLDLSRQTVEVTSFAPVPETDQQVAGHHGTVICQAIS